MTAAVNALLMSDIPSGFFMADSSWTFDDIKAFELALARHFADQDRWDKLAAAFPQKDRVDLQLKFRELEDDLMRIEEGPFTSGGCSRTSSTTGSDVSAPLFPPVILTTHTQPPPYHSAPATTKKGGNKAENAAGDRRKGVPWTEEEHRLFLAGLAKFGKGDWRSIARNFVTTRTPTQVASHAQKYFIRLNSQNKKDKRRASIHDITSPIDPNSVSSLQVPNPLPSQNGGTSSSLSLGGGMSFSSGPSLLPPVAPSLVNLTV